MFIKSLRLGDFSLFCSCLRDILPWFFALDHTHYSRWMSVFLEDVLKLQASNEGTYQALSKGYFTVRKTNRNFSCIGIDQAHEQNNKIVKGDGGAIGIMDNKSKLLRWAVAGPIIADMLNVQGEMNNGEICSHHEDNDNFEASFKSDIEALTQASTECGICLRNQRVNSYM